MQDATTSSSVTSQRSGERKVWAAAALLAAIALTGGLWLGPRLQSGFTADDASAVMPPAEAPAFSQEQLDKAGLPPLSRGDSGRIAANLPATPDAIAPVPPPRFGDLGHGFNAPGYLVKSASLQLEVANLQQSFASLTTLAEKYQGYIVDSEMSNAESRQPGARLSLKLPSARLGAALAELNGLGTVRSQQIKTEDLWLQIKRQELEIGHLQKLGQTKAKTAGPEDGQYQIRLQQLERLRLEDMLKMATVSLNLSERAPFWDLRPLGEELRGKSYEALATTTRLLAQVLLFLPPLLIFLGLAWIGWLLLRAVLVGRLALLNEKHLGAMYAGGLVFFPLTAIGPRALGPVIIFVLLLGAIWSSRLLLRRLRPPTAPVPPAP